MSRLAATLLLLGLLLLTTAPSLTAPGLGGELPAATTLHTGDFEVRWDPERGGRLWILHDSASRELWSSLPGQAFVGAALADARWRGERGSFSYEGEDARVWTRGQRVDALRAVGGGVEVYGRLALTGHGVTQALAGGDEEPTVAYVLRFEALDEVQLGFQLRFEGPPTALNRASLRFAAAPTERFVGFGTQFSHVEMTGRQVPILTREQGIGRGLQPLSFLLNRAGRAGGDWSTSYAAVPHYLTTELRSLCLETAEPAVFDLTQPRTVGITLHGPELRGRLFHGESPLELLEAYTRYAGRMRPLPDWMHAGAVVGMMGGEQVVRDKLHALEAQGVPVSALFIQDWVGRRETPLGTRLWWNWEPDTASYPDWSGFVAELRERGVRVLSYVNPWLVSKPDAQRDLFAEARELGYLVKDADGHVLEEDSGGFGAALLDLSNPEARTWFKAVIRDQVIATGVSGWMADFGEALPFDAQLAGADPRAFHNRYPEVWAQLQREAIDEAGLQDELVPFSRSGYTRSPGVARLFWLGDQLPSWDRHDGMRSALTGMLSSGMSGFALQHSDTGGYTNLTLGPFKAFTRQPELLQRWAEWSAFTAVLRTHEGLAPEANTQVWSPETAPGFARCARLFQALFSYRQRLMHEAAAHGWPLVRQHWLQHPEHPELLDVRDQYSLGADLVVAPVMQQGAERVTAILPPGRWVHLWSGDVYGEEAAVTRVRLAAPLGEPAALYREGSPVGQELQAFVAREASSSGR